MNPAGDCSVSAPVPVSGTVTSRLSISQPAALGPHLDDDRIAGGRAGPNDQIDRALVVHQRADRRRVSVRQVVERPAVADALVVEEVVVADDAAFDSA